MGTEAIVTLKSVQSRSLGSVNFTAALDRELLRRAKVLAAQHDASLNAELRYPVDTFEKADQLGNRTASALLAFGGFGQALMPKPLVLPGDDLPVMMADAGPWITLIYADALDLLLAAGWPLVMVDMVLQELTRSDTPTSQHIATWVA